MILAGSSKQKQSTTCKSMERDAIFGTGKGIAKAEDGAGTQRKTLEYTRLYVQNKSKQVQNKYKYKYKYKTSTKQEQLNSGEIWSLWWTGENSNKKTQTQFDPWLVDLIPHTMGLTKEASKFLGVDTI